MWYSRFVLQAVVETAAEDMDGMPARNTSCVHYICSSAVPCTDRQGYSTDERSCQEMNRLPRPVSYFQYHSILNVSEECARNFEEENYRTVHAKESFFT